MNEVGPGLGTLGFLVLVWAITGALFYRSIRDANRWAALGYAIAGTLTAIASIAFTVGVARAIGSWLAAPP